jgi:hypothetical protein
MGFLERIVEEANFKILKLNTLKPDRGPIRAEIEEYVLGRRLRESEVSEPR